MDVELGRATGSQPQSLVLRPVIADMNHVIRWSVPSSVDSHICRIPSTDLSGSDLSRAASGSLCSALRALRVRCKFNLPFRRRRSGCEAMKGFGGRLLC